MKRMASSSADYMSIHADPMVIDQQPELAAPSNDDMGAEEEETNRMLDWQPPLSSLGTALKRICRPLADRAFEWFSSSSSSRAVATLGGSSNIDTTFRHPFQSTVTTDISNDDHLFRRPIVPSASASAAEHPSTLAAPPVVQQTTKRTPVAEESALPVSRSRIRSISNSSTSSSVLLQRSRPSSLNNPTLRKLMREKDRTANPLDRILRSCPSHQEMQIMGYRSTEKDYRDLITYADQVYRITQTTPSKSNYFDLEDSSSRLGKSSSAVDDENDAMSIVSSSSRFNIGILSSSVSNFGNSKHQKFKSVMHISPSALTSGRLSQPTTGSSAVSNHRHPTTPIRPVNFAEEESWIRRLRSEIENIQKYAVPNYLMALAKQSTYPKNRREKSSKDIEFPTPLYDKLVEKNQQKITPAVAESKELAVVDSDRNFPELTPTMIVEIKQALGRKPLDSILLSQFSVDITPDILGCLNDGKWLNDEVINFYMQLIMARAGQFSDKYPAVHCFNTFFFATLDKQGYPKVRRWTKKVDLFSKQLIIIPVHLNIHWCCAAINFERKRFEYYDSLHGNNSKAFKLLRSYLEQESLDKRGIPIDLSDWQNHSPKNIPAQENGYDCGVFTCIFAEYLSRREPFDFSQQNMRYYRQRIVYEILQSKLLI